MACPLQFECGHRRAPREIKRAERIAAWWANSHTALHLIVIPPSRFSGLRIVFTKQPVAHVVFDGLKRLRSATAKFQIVMAINLAPRSST
jgi:hypothetical protein